MKETPIKHCEYCNKLMKRKRYNGRLEGLTEFKRRKYCGIECMRKDKIHVGKNNSNWSNSHTTARNINELIINEHNCKECGKEGRLDVHHKDGDFNNNNLNNLEVLCRSCHMKKHKMKKKCKICGEPQKGLGYCNKHYLRFKKYGDPNFTKIKQS